MKLLKLKYSQEKVLSSQEESDLSYYSSILDGHLDWEVRQQYLELLEKLINGKIDTFKFCIEFKKRNELNGEVFDVLEANFLLLSPHEKSVKYFLDLYESEFRDSIEKIYRKIQKFLEE